MSAQGSPNPMPLHVVDMFAGNAPGIMGYPAGMTTQAQPPVMQPQAAMLNPGAQIAPHFLQSAPVGLNPMVQSGMLNPGAQIAPHYTQPITQAPAHYMPQITQPAPGYPFVHPGMTPTAQPAVNQLRVGQMPMNNGLPVAYTASLQGLRR
jgi:hypothetical protein